MATRKADGPTQIIDMRLSRSLVENADIILKAMLARGWRVTRSTVLIAAIHKGLPLVAKELGVDITTVPEEPDDRKSAGRTKAYLRVSNKKEKPVK